MRLKVKEALDLRNAREGDEMTLEQLAERVYHDRKTSNITKRCRISAINTGRKPATVVELVRIAEILGADVLFLIPKTETA